jgi:hypothetical protein
MFKKHFLFACLPFFLSACLSMDTVTSLAEPQYQVVFDEKPAITQETVFADGYEIGKVLSQKLVAKDRVVTTVSIKRDHTNMMQRNTVFYVTGGHLELDQVGEDSTPLKTDESVLGFTSKASLLAFKFKNKFKNVAEEAFNKAQKLLIDTVGN